jgi:hypothetical protein
MKPHPRIRKTIKWGGAAVTVLLVVVWIGSGAGRAVLSSGTLHAGLTLVNGRIGVWSVSATGTMPTPPTGFEGHRFRRPEWALEAQWAPSPLVIVPLWLPIALLAAPTAAAWCLDTLARRRARIHLCRKCGYDRAGIAASAVCPECGMAEQR